ncbi:Sec63-domain-containing protein [Lentinula edodes]|uniref:Sec63-domain-containing protein n=1 Tax=Lentinula edodes TaxID=5353 RepID=A0A1Q3E010_LENED|nr:Sec63-domain-containing protein [Lentinula edodes]
MAPDCKVSFKSSSLLSLRLGRVNWCEGGTCGGDKTQQQQPSSDRVDRFLNPGIDMANLEKHLEFMSDEGLKEVLGHGVGYYHETLSEQDTIVQRLFESGAVQVLVYLRVYCYQDELDAVSPLNLGMITEHYNISYVTVEVISMTVSPENSTPPPSTTNSRTSKPSSSSKPTSAMCVQAVWERDSPLKQIPHFEAEVIRRCADAGLESVYDVMGYGGWKCIDIEVLKMSNAQMQDVAAFVSSYLSRRHTGTRQR